MADYDRPVANRGIRDIETVGSFLYQSKIIPDFVLTSSALRASTTASEICKKLCFNGPIESHRVLYFGGVSSLVDIIRSVDDKFKHVFAFFHNPDINELAIDRMKVPVKNIPTLGCVFTECDERHWKHWSIEKATLRGFTSPKRLKKGIIPEL